MKFFYAAYPFDCKKQRVKTVTALKRKKKVLDDILALEFEPEAALGIKLCSLSLSPYLLGLSLSLTVSAFCVFAVFSSHLFYLSIFYLSSLLIS